MGVLSTPATLLRAHPYRDTSQILRFFTAELGVTGAVARGVRKRSGKGGGTLPTFGSGILELHHREGRDLQTFRDFTVTHPRRGLGLDLRRFGGASFLGELMLRHAGEQGNAPLHDTFRGALDRMETTPGDRVAAEVVAWGWVLVTMLGYAPELQVCVSCGTPLEPGAMAWFDHTAGGVRCVECRGGVELPRMGPGARGELSALLASPEEGELRAPEAHLRLLHDFVGWHLGGGRPMDSYPFLAGVLLGGEVSAGGRGLGGETGPEGRHGKGA